MYLPGKFRYFLLFYGFFLQTTAETNHSTTINLQTIFTSVLTPEVLDESESCSPIHLSYFENLQTNNTLYVPQGYMVSATTNADEFFSTIPLQHSTVYESLKLPIAHTSDINYSLSRVKGIKPVRK